MGPTFDDDRKIILLTLRPATQAPLCGAAVFRPFFLSAGLREERTGEERPLSERGAIMADAIRWPKAV